MEYIFGTEKDIEVLKTISLTPEELSGFGIIEMKYPDQTIIDRFHIIRKFREKQDTEGKFYKWYEIDKHNRIIDKSEPIKAASDRNLANIDYLSMMTGINLPETEE